MASWRLSSVVGALSFAYLTTAQCYFSNGSLVPGETFEPCNNIAGTNSMCCALNRTASPGSVVTDINNPNQWPRDTCLPNGLCQNFIHDSAGDEFYTYWRGFCSASNWDGCLKNICGNLTASITPCSVTYETTKWCCGLNASACCSDWDHHPDAVTIPLVLGDGTATNASSNGSSISNSTSTNTSSNNGLSTGAKAGIGVGVALGVVLLVGIAASIWWSRRHNKRRRAPAELAGNPVRTINEDGFGDKTHEKVGGQAELSSELEPAELDAHRYHQLEAPQPQK